VDLFDAYIAEVTLLQFVIDVEDWYLNISVVLSLCDCCWCSFIKQYYEKLARNPQDLYKFYKENSFYTYVDGVQVRP
jgi:hypothetical protein